MFTRVHEGILTYVLVKTKGNQKCQPKFGLSEWEETNFLGQDRDREIRPTKIYYETETEKKWMLIFLTRRDLDETV